MCRHMNQGIWWRLGGGGGPFGLHRETLTFEVLSISYTSEQNSFEIRHTATSLEVVRLFKGLTARRL
jgi:hypothetical protein